MIRGGLHVVNDEFGMILYALYMRGWIYIYICVCVCVCGHKSGMSNDEH